VIYFVNNWFRVSQESESFRKLITAGQISTGDAWKKYEDLRGRTRLPLIGVRDPLKRRLSEAGDEPIHDYRRDPLRPQPFGIVHLSNAHLGGDARRAPAERAAEDAQAVSGTMLSASFTVDYIPNWRVSVRAHNAIGWGPWSSGVTLGGL